MSRSGFRWLYCMSVCLVCLWIGDIDPDMKVVGLTLGILGLMFAIEDWFPDGQ